MSQDNAGFRPPEQLDDLADPLRELDRALLEDGAVWRHHLPDADQAAEIAIARLDQADATEAAGAPPTKSVELKSPPAARRGDMPTRPAARRRGGAAAAVAAMAAVVTLVALVLHAGLARSVVTPHATPTVAPTASASATAAPLGKWMAVSDLTGSVYPAFSPLDPSLAYQTMYSASNPNVYVRRTDDGGTTWHTLPTPSVAGLSPAETPGPDLAAIPSPLDVDTVFLVVSAPAQGNGQPCTAPATARASAGGFLARTSGIPYCDFSYISQDRGAHWQHVALPDGDIGFLGGDSGLRPTSQAHNIIAQGARLYSYDHVENAGVTSGYLVASDDHGLTWQAIDGAIRAQGQSVLDYDCAPGGETIFAVSTDPLTATIYYLWRSDDAGAHWQHWQLLSNGAFSSFGGIAVVQSAANASPTLYIAGHVVAGEGDPASATNFHVSLDGGLTWQSTPTAGITADKLLPSILGVLRDGSIIVQAPAAEESGPVPLEFYAWRVGASSWRTLSPPVLAQSLFAITSAGAGGSETLWVETPVVDNAGDVTAETQRYILP